MRTVFIFGVKPRGSVMSARRVLSKGKFCWLAVVLVGVSGLSPLSCKNSKEAGTFYLRSCETGKLIGPIQTTPGRPLPPLEEETYVVADPSESELDIRKRLLAANLYENHYLDCEIADVIGTIRQMLKHRIGDEAPPFRVEGLDAIVSMDISDEEPAYEVLFRIAAKAKARVFIEDGVVIFSRRKLPELAYFDATTSETVARRELPSR